MSESETALKSGICRRDSAPQSRRERQTEKIRQEKFAQVGKY
jgi:hypothetical protein